MKRHLLIACGFVCLAIHGQISLTPQYEEIAERGKVLQYKVQSGGEEFLLTPPGGWDFDLLAADNMLVFRNERFAAVFTVKFTENAPPRAAKELRALVEQRFAGAKGFESFSCITPEGEGFGLSAQFAAADGSLFENRLGLIPFGRRTIELSLTAPADAISKTHSAWISVLNSLRRKSASS